jgi:hypothetical protein
LDQRPASGTILPGFLETRSRSRAGSSSTMRAHLDNRSSRFRGRRIRAILAAGHRDGSRPRGRETRCFAATSVAESRCSKALPTRASRACLAPRHTVGAARATRSSPDTITWPSLKSPCNAPARRSPPARAPRRSAHATLHGSGPLRSLAQLLSDTPSMNSIARTPSPCAHPPRRPRPHGGETAWSAHEFAQPLLAMFALARQPIEVYAV